VFLSGLGFSIQATVLKLLPSIPTFQTVFFRGLVQCCVSLLLLQKTKSESPTTQTNLQKLRSTPLHTYKLLVLRSTSGFIGIAFAFSAIRLIPIGVCTTIVMLSPVLASLIARVFLGEQISTLTFFALPMTMAGLVFIIQPEFLFKDDDDIDDTDDTDDLNMVGVLFAFIAAIGAGFAYVLIRVLGTSSKCYWGVVTLFQAIGQMVYGLPLIFVLPLEPGVPTPLNFAPSALGGCLLIGIIGTLSQGLMTVGMQREKSARATIMRMGDVVFSFFFQITLTTDKTVSLLEGFGVACVVFGVLLVVIDRSSSQVAEAEETKNYDAVQLVDDFNKSFEAEGDDFDEVEIEMT
jgi:drug/metabolite transporter (DMT)-like permease